jgi:mono/diheme cytochrome c family protein
MKPDRAKMLSHDVEAEPEVGHAEIPIILLPLLAGLIFLGALYLDQYGGGFENKVYSPYQSIAQVNKAQPTDPAMTEFLAGKQVYETMCMLCHQTTGQGTPMFPPLDGSEWVTGPVGRLVRIPHNGLNGPITVKGVDWNSSMPAIGASLSDQDMARVLTYIRGAWSNKAGRVTVEQVANVRKQIADRGTAWTTAELLQVND